jgi:hypothetical protein
MIRWPLTEKGPTGVKRLLVMLNDDGKIMLQLDIFGLPEDLYFVDDHTWIV